jgi:hypothetical protein
MTTVREQSIKYDIGFRRKFKNSLKYIDSARRKERAVFADQHRKLLIPSQRRDF